MTEFLRYLSRRRKIFALAAVCMGIFALVFWLYKLPIQAAVYPGLLSLLVLVIALLSDYGRQRRMDQALAALTALPDSLGEDLRELGADERYAAIIRALLAREGEEKAAAENLSRGRMDYFTAWVHQIKTPIAAMELTLQGMDDSCSRALKEELVRVEQYVQMVLTYLRLDSETTDFVFREVGLDHLIKSALRRFAGQFIRKGIALQYIPTGKTVVTDEKWLLFVVEQILSNALKYTAVGSVTIDVAGNLLSIRDTGIGIAPEDLPRIFQRGYTGFNGRLEQRSSGIGLYLCKRICDSLGIRISAQSQPGVGTCLQLDFPERPGNFE